jgi:hypothetical protein
MRRNYKIAPLIFFINITCEAEYEFFRRMGNPEPMIELLQSAIDMRQAV